ncbi:MAG TPA: cation-transporting P-type ATPase, partial [Ideonella sp.]|nr:cation-transporting P-type ATPase [Ideonella sp.]
MSDAPAHDPTGSAPEFAPTCQPRPSASACCSGACGGPLPISPAARDDEDGQAPVGGLPRMAGALVLAIAAEAISLASPAWAAQALSLSVAGAAIGLAGLDVFRNGLAALRQARLNIDALMSVAVAGAFVIGQWPEAAMVMALYAIAEWLEARAVDRARHAITGLLAMAPDAAAARQADGSWQTLPVAQVAVGATVRIRPGERVPLDGVVAEGWSAVDQAPVTGESIPVDKAPGDPVFAGTINRSGTLVARVTAEATKSTLARIIHAVEQAQGSRAPMQ